MNSNNLWTREHEVAALNQISKSCKSTPHLDGETVGWTGLGPCPTCYARFVGGERKISQTDFLKVFMSQTIVKLQKKGQMVIPRSLREEAGIAEGTLLKIVVLKGGQFLLTPQFTVDRSVIADDPAKTRTQSLRDLAAVVAELRQEAKEKGLDKMPKREINAAVAAAREDLKVRSKRPSK